MGLLYLLVGLACGVAVGMNIRKRDAAAPEISVPDITSPDVSVPGISVPDIPAPDASVPGASLPETADSNPDDAHEEEGEPPRLPRFPDVEYDIEPDDR